MNRAVRRMPNAPHARSPFSPKHWQSCAGWGWPRNRNQELPVMPMTTCLPTSMNSAMNLRDALEFLSQTRLVETVLRAIALPWLWRLTHDFAPFAHRHQRPPAAANNGGPWTTWLALGGRGAGKTRLGAEFVRALALGLPPYADAPHGHIALVGETDHDVREVMIEGASGLMRAGAWRERPVWSPARKRLEGVKGG